MSMDSELSISQLSPTPKLSLFSLPNHTPEKKKEVITPPFETPASVPFKWEEAPGKPRRDLTGDGAGGEAPAKPKAARCLELPPGKITDTPSPSPDMDGPGSSPKLSSFLKVLEIEGKITNTPSPSSDVAGPEPRPGLILSSFRKVQKGKGEITNTPSPKSDLAGPSPKLSSFRKVLKGKGGITNTPSSGSDLAGPSPKFSSFRKVLKEKGENRSTPSPSSGLDEPGSGPIISKTMSFSFRKLLKGEGKVTSTPSPSSVLDGPGLGPNVSKTMSFSFRKFLKGDGKMTTTPSPSSVLDGPCLGPAVSQTMSFTFRNSEDGLVRKLVGEEMANFSSLRWGSEKGFGAEGEGNLDFSSPFEAPDANTTRLRKRSGFWANIYKNVKQAVPWKRRQDKRRKMNL